MKYRVGCSLVLATITFASFAVNGSAVAYAETGSAQVNVSSAGALADDVAAYAASSGLSDSKILAYVAGQDKFGEQVSRFREKYPTVFVDAVWDGPDSSKTAVYVNSKSVDFDNLTYGRLVYVDAMSVAQRDALVSEVMGALVAEFDLSSLSVSSDSLSEQLTVEYSGTVEKAEMLKMVEAATGNLARQIGSLKNGAGRAGAQSTIIIRHTELVGPEFGSGGNWNGKNCTAGFTAVRGGKTAITTTSHCGSVAKYDGATISKRRKTTAAQGDVSSFIATGVQQTNSLRYDWDKHRAIKHSWNPVLGNVVCHFGVTSGQSCAEVVAVGHRQWFKDIGEVGNLVVVDKDISLPGDSGGPWFWSDRAHGIHMGDCQLNGRKSCFTAIGALAYIGTRVYTG